MSSNTIDSAPLTIDTLDEPVYDTIIRDIKRVGVKLWHVLLPRGKAVEALRDWDLWGPLILCLTLAIILGQSGTEPTTIFAAVFVIIWCGAAVVTVNAALLGGNISFFQSVCVLGYCTFPLVIASIISAFTSIVTETFLIKGITVSIAFVWSTGASVAFMSGMVPESKRLLAVYPVLLFYLIISWMILNQ